MSGTIRPIASCLVLFAFASGSNAGFLDKITQSVSNVKQDLTNKVKAATSAVSAKVEEVKTGVSGTAGALMAQIGQSVDNTIGQSLDAVIEPAISEEDKKRVDTIFQDAGQIERTGLINAQQRDLTDVHMPYFVEKLEQLAQATQAGTSAFEKMTLNLSGNQITAQGIDTLIKKLQAYPRFISILGLAGNNIGDEGVTVLANGLKSMAFVKYIILSNTGITGDGALAIFSEIAKQSDSVFQMLDFSNNEITGDYWQLILDQVKMLRSGVLEDGITFSSGKLNLDPNAVIPRQIRLV
ncbi:MAG: hypothetical protein LBT03_00595 [Holosporales bacterium]|jgi:hypothetical protein|nr:hypothetical protein [Holosporales bacterium]